MQFLDDVRMPCEFCDGTRYRGEARKLEDRGKTIVDVLAMSVDEALEFYAEERTDPRSPGRRSSRSASATSRSASRSRPSRAVKPQRLRLAQALREGAPRTLYVLDEPTTGLHPADIEVLLGCLDALLARGGSVIVVEHNLDVIRRADHVIDLGPEGGPRRWPRARVRERRPRSPASPGSHTGAALKPLL